jgi:hypothetical protein
MSVMPNPPGRVETKYRLSPSGENVAAESKELELTTGPRFTGSDHAEKVSQMGGSDSALDWTSKATSRGRKPSARTRWTSLVFMEPPHVEKLRQLRPSLLAISDQPGIIAGNLGDSNPHINTRRLKY